MWTEQKNSLFCIVSMKARGTKEGKSVLKWVTTSSTAHLGLCSPVTHLQKITQCSEFLMLLMSNHVECIKKLHFHTE